MSLRIRGQEKLVEIIGPSFVGRRGVGNGPVEEIPMCRMTQVNSSRSLSRADFEQVLKCASAVAITIPTDDLLFSGVLVDDDYCPSIMLFMNGASAPTLVTTGLTVVGTAPTISANTPWAGIARVGPNKWAYL